MPIVLLLAALSARADDGVDTLLQNIPTIEQKAEAPAAPPPPPPELDRAGYARLVQGHLLGALALTDKEKQKHAAARVTLLVKIDAQGGLTQAVLTESSGDKRFEKRVLASLEAAAPYPAPPAAFVLTGPATATVTLTGRGTGG